MASKRLVLERESSRIHDACVDWHAKALGSSPASLQHGRRDVHPGDGHTMRNARGRGRCRPHQQHMLTRLEAEALDGPLPRPPEVGCGDQRVAQGAQNV